MFIIVLFVDIRPVPLQTLLCNNPTNCLYFYLLNSTQRLFINDYHTGNFCIFFFSRFLLFLYTKNMCKFFSFLFLFFFLFIQYKIFIFKPASLISFYIFTSRHLHRQSSRHTERRHRQTHRQTSTNIGKFEWTKSKTKCNEMIVVETYNSVQYARNKKEKKKRRNKKIKK